MKKVNKSFLNLVLSLLSFLYCFAIVFWNVTKTDLPDPLVQQMKILSVEKGIYYSSRDSKDNRDRNIYEGSWKDDVKNGAFVVYSSFRGDFPLSEKGTVLKSVYDGSEKITYVNDRNKEEMDQEERDRKQSDKDEIQKNKCLKECSYWENERISRSGRVIKDEGYNCRSKKCEEFMGSTIPQ